MYNFYSEKKAGQNFLFDFKPEKTELKEDDINAILDQIEDEFYLNRKNFWSVKELQNLLKKNRDEIIKLIYDYELDAICIESQLKVPYNKLIDWIFFKAEWQQQKKAYYQFTNSNKGYSGAWKTRTSTI